ncbi:MAG: hypothetical protein WC263_04360 [Candidatus Micrarchaeia archaeon]|jgi:hypothetical protein
MKANARFAFALLALAVSACFATAPDPPTYMETCGVDSFATAGGGEALSFIAIAFAIVSFAIGLAYMYSKVREDPATGVWAKDEAYNLVVSLLLFAGILVFFTGACSIAQSYAGNKSPITASQMYLDALLQSNGLNVLKELESDSLRNQLDATKYSYLGLSPFWGGGVAVRANRKSYSAQREYLIDLYLPIVASLTAQKYVLQGIAWMGASVLLPFAFVLRLVPPTREFGNMLLALFFGMYIVAPTMYAMSAQVFADNVMNTTPYSVTSLQKFQSYGLDNSQAAPSDIKATVFYRIGSVLPQAIFIPNLVILVTVTSIMAVSKALRAIAI